MTDAAQFILLRVMELHQDTTRFALACNDSTKLIEGIQSRCTILRFAKLTDEDVATRVAAVCEEEGLECTPEGVQALVFVSDGDMRHALNTLQAAAATAKDCEPIGREAVLRACDHPDPDIIKGVLDVGWSDAVHGLLPVLDAWEGLVRAGYSAADVLGTLHRVVKTSPVLPPFVKLEVLRVVAEHSTRAKDGLASVLQVHACACEVYATCRAGRADSGRVEGGFMVIPTML
jgi:replication factor C subunit 2/4